MNINKTNYEAFFLDYHEGNLSPEEVLELLLFVENHPELKEEFDSFENSSIDPDHSFYFENKAILKKYIDADTINEYFIKSVESTLNSIEKELLADFIKKNPHYKTDFDLFQKTKNTPDFSIVFEHKEALKKVDVMDELSISSIEGLLSKPETVLLTNQLAIDAKLKNDLALYQQTKLVADSSIVFENKDELKHLTLAPFKGKEKSERKVIPLFYYVAAAASIALLFGLYILLNDTTSEQKFAATTNDSIKQIKNNTSTTLENKVAESKKSNRIKSIDVVNNASQVAVKSNLSEEKEKSKGNISIKNLEKDSVTTAPLINQQLPINLANRDLTEEKKQENLMIPSKEEPMANPNHQETIAKTEKKKANVIPLEFLSLRELAAEKIKEKILDESTLEAQKKSGKNKKISGWDIAQIVTKGMSKLTGRNMEVKPTYNEQGDVTAYAFGNGLHVSKGK